MQLAKERELAAKGDEGGDGTPNVSARENEGGD